MQLMPKTAYRVAQRLNIRYSRSRLTRDPKYNVTIGRAYLLQLLEDYGGSPILALSAYNAGPARVKRGPQLPAHLRTCDGIRRRRVLT